MCERIWPDIYANLNIYLIINNHYTQEMKTLVIALIVTAAMAHSMNNDSRHKYDEKLKKCKAKALADPLHFCFGSHALVQHAIPCLEHATDHQVQAIYKTFGASSK